MKLDNVFKLAYRTHVKRLMLLVAGTFCFSSYVQADSLAIGDVIAVDFANDGGSATNFNIIDSNTTMTAGNVKLWDGGSLVDDVSLTFSGADGFANSSEFDDWSGAIADPYYVDDANDAAYASGAGSSLVLTFSGLDDSFKYNLRVYSLYQHENPGGRNNRTEDFEVTDGVGTISSGLITRASRWDASTLEDGGTVFDGLSTDGSGNLVLTVTAGVGDNPFINAAVLQVIPEPSTSVLVFALIAFPVALLRRR